MKFRAYFSQSVRYSYEICDVLVPNFHALLGIDTNDLQYESTKCDWETVNTKMKCHKMRGLEISFGYVVHVSSKIWCACPFQSRYR